MSIGITIDFDYSNFFRRDDGVLCIDAECHGLTMRLIAEVTKVTQGLLEQFRDRLGGDFDPRRGEICDFADPLSIRGKLVDPGVMLIRELRYNGELFGRVTVSRSLGGQSFTVSGEMLNPDGTPVEIV